MWVFAQSFVWSAKLYISTCPCLKRPLVSVSSNPFKLFVGVVADYYCYDTTTARPLGNTTCTTTTIIIIIFIPIIINTFTSY